MKDSKKPWLPLWVDSWLFGSTRLELTPEQRSVFTDFLCLARKDNGFIRANENVPYPTAQLAGLLCVPESLIIETIDRCLEVDKLERRPEGTLFVVNWQKYQLVPRHVRRLSPLQSSPLKEKIKPKGKEKERKGKTDIESAKADIESSEGDFVPLPSIPKNFPFGESHKKLTKLKARIEEAERLLRTPAEIKKHQGHDGRMLTEEKLRTDIRRMRAEYMKILK